MVCLWLQVQDTAHSSSTDQNLESCTYLCLISEVSVAGSMLSCKLDMLNNTDCTHSVLLLQVDVVQCQGLDLLLLLLVQVLPALHKQHGMAPQLLRVYKQPCDSTCLSTAVSGTMQLHCWSSQFDFTTSHRIAAFRPLSHCQCAPVEHKAGVQAQLSVC